MIKKALNKWISHQTEHPEGRLNLFCFVFAGGSPSFFAPWKNKFPADVNFYPILYPNREKRIKEVMPEQVSQLVEQFRAENKNLLSKPYAIWGHCSGALIGMELAYLESQQGNPPESFIISGCEAPEYALNRLQIKKNFDEVKDEDIMKDLILFNLMAPEMVNDPTFQKYFLPIYRADLKMFSTYKCADQIRLSCPALIMNGKEDKMIKAECIPGWKQRFDQEIQFETWSGGHYFVNDHKDEIADEIIKFMNQAERRN